ncbi:MAG: GNAT family N-acyltransferase [bacterium]
MVQLHQELSNPLEINYYGYKFLRACSNQPQDADSSEPDHEKSITVRKAVTLDDMVKVFQIRYEGYKKYYKSEDENMDQNDFSSHACLLLAEDKHHNPVGTIRILDRRYGKIELDNFVNLDSFLPEGKSLNVIEATRFSIPNHLDSKLIKMLLWKALFLYCQVNHIDTIIMSARPAAARSYRCLLFENVGSLGVYKHPLLGNLEHQTYKCIISEKKHQAKEKNWPLYQFFFVKDHPNIKLDCFKLYNHDNNASELSIQEKTTGVCIN